MFGVLGSHYKCAVDFFNEEMEKEKSYEIRQVKYLNNIVEQITGS